MRKRADDQAIEAEALRGTEHEPVALDAASAAVLVHELRVHQIELETQNEELRQAQVALEVSRARYFDLYDLAPVGYLALDGDGSIAEANLTAATMLGLDRSALIHQPMTRFVARDDQDGFFQLRRRLARVGSPQSCELRLSRYDGTSSWARLEASDSSGRSEQSSQHEAGDADSRSCRLVMTDISAQKQAEQTLKASEARVAEADRLASMGMLAAGIAHEINNPLAYTIYNLESVATDLPELADAVKRCSATLRSELGAERYESLVGSDDGAPLKAMIDCVREAHHGTLRIRSIARALGTFARSDATERAPVDVNRAIELAITIAFNEIRHCATIVQELAVVPPVLASEGKLTQVFLNLLINAAHAIGEGDAAGNTISIRTRVEQLDVVIEVEDTGRGIARADLALVFEPFQASTAKGAASGLGLAMSKSIVGELGGALSVDSDVGKGARFVVRLPAATSAGETRPCAPPEPRQHGSGAPRRGRVLIVDDEAAIRAVTKRLLDGAHDVVLAASGQEALAILEVDSSFDVILCDLMMPQMTGMELHERLRKHDPRLVERVVFLSGGVFSPNAVAYLAEHNPFVLQKPLDSRELRRIVAERVALAIARGDASS